MGKKGFRILAAVLALACLAGTVAAATTISLDLNGDSIVNIWDAQHALFSDNIKDAERQDYVQAITGQILGTGSELTPDSDGVYEITSSQGLLFMAENPDNQYKLMNDIDLGGIDWTPVADFAGSFDGQGHTIYNFTITQPGQDGSDYTMGFFRDTEDSSVIRDLHLADMRILVPESSTVRFVGGIAGTCRGDIIGCTVAGSVVDTRAESGVDSTAIYYGALAGRIGWYAENKTVSGADSLTLVFAAEDGTVTVDGKEVTLTDGETYATRGTVTVPEGAKIYTTEGICAALKLNIQNTDHVALVGNYNPDQTYTLSGKWYDTRYSTQAQPELLQTRRQTAVDYMYEMGTVQWTPAKTLTYVSATDPNFSWTNWAYDLTGSTHSNVFQQGVTYTGLPYNGCAGSMERFLSVMKNGDEENAALYTTAEGLTNGYYLSSADETGEARKGFIQYMGNDCSSAISWAWSRISHSYTPASGKTSTYFGAFAYVTRNMVPDGNYYYKTTTGGSTVINYRNGTDYYGMLAVGDYPNSANTKDTRTLIANLVDDGGTSATNADCEIMAECYAQARLGDALLYCKIDNEWTADGQATDSNGNLLTEDYSGHARMLAYDPVVIRNADGSIDLSESYVVTHEQGDGLYDNDGTKVKQSATINGETKTAIFTHKLTSWRIDRQYSFELLLKGTQNGVSVTDNKIRGSGYGYIPITISVYSYNSANDSTWLQENGKDHKITAPDNGQIYSHYRIISTTLTIMDKDDPSIVVYEETKYAGVGANYRDRLTTVDLAKLHGGYGQRAGDKLVSNTEYQFTITVNLSSGRSAAMNEIKTIEDSDVYLPQTMTFNYIAE